MGKRQHVIGLVLSIILGAYLVYSYPNILVIISSFVLIVLQTLTIKKSKYSMPASYGLIYLQGACLVILFALISMWQNSADANMYMAMSTIVGISATVVSSALYLLGFYFSRSNTSTPKILAVPENSRILKFGLVFFAIVGVAIVITSFL